MSKYRVFSILFLFVVFCQPLSIPHVHVTYSSFPPLMGIVASTGCNSNYFQMGPTQRTCQADRTWSDESPVCINVMQLKHKLVIPQSQFILGFPIKV